MRLIIDELTKEEVISIINEISQPIKLDIKKEVKPRRLDLIVNHIPLDKAIRLESLWRMCRRKGYAMNRRTFSRDIDRLYDEKVIMIKQTKGGKLGTFNLVTLNQTNTEENK